MSTQAILITRPKEDAKEIAKILSDKNHIVLCEPFLKVVYDDFTLPNLEGCAGLIFTSANAVRTFETQMLDLSIPVFCVGDQTAKAARDIGFININNAQGAVQDMVALIAKYKTDKHFLYIRGRDVSKDIKKLIPDNKIEELVVYHTEIVDEISARVKLSLMNGDIDSVLFFSKRTAVSFVGWINQQSGAELLKEGLKRTKALCLGDSMLQSLSVLSWKEIKVAKTPDRAGILALVDDTEETGHMDEERIQEKPKMSKNAKKPIENAGQVIERFGGIRPMAAKIDTPVTTVQGWKKRDVIPATRREQILSAAEELKIDISDIAGGSSEVANENNEQKPAEPKQEKQAEPKVEKEPAKTEPVSEKPKTEDVVKLPRANAETSTSEKPQAEKQESQSKPEAKEKSYAPETPSRRGGTYPGDDILEAVEQKNRKTMIACAWITAGMLLLAGLVWALMTGSGAKESNTKLATLEQEVGAVNQKAESFDKAVSSNIEQQVADLRRQAASIQNTVTQLSDKTREITNDFSDVSSSPISRRLMVLEEQMASLSNAKNFGGIVNRIRRLEETLPGQEQLQSSVDQLQNMVSKVGDRQNTLDQSLQEVQNSENGGALGETLKGVSSNDLKAAAMLIAFSQLRDSLNRQAAFQNDLALLERLVDEDDVELKMSIARLAPHADGGVLTASGLSGEFKGLAGDVLESSLKGEEISFTEKAKARLTNIMKVEKEGELVTGTETQQTISRAQKFLDEGDIQSAITELETLEGDPAKTVQGFIEKAKVSLMAENVQEMLADNILEKVRDQIPNGIGGGANLNNLDMNEVKRRLKEASPMSNNIVRDEESGLSVLPSQQGFRGFSAGE